MRVDLHNHTTLCNHAQGSMEEYILKAIDERIDVFGFSEHAPMNFDKKYRLDIESKSYYENSVLSLQKKYENQIEILLAYEVDYIKGYMLDEVLNSNVDYLIGSIHFLAQKSKLWGFDNPEFIGHYENVNIDTIWKDYFDAIKEMAQSNLFDVVGHMDLIKVFKFLPTKDIKSLANEAMKSIKKANMVLEINAAGFRKPIKEQYPSKELLEMAFELDIPITFSSDAHAVDQVGFSYDKTSTLAKELGYTTCITFKNRDRKVVTF